MLLSCWLFGIFFGPAVLSQSTCIPTLYLPGNPAAAAIAFVTFFSSFSTSSMSTSEPVLPALVRHSCLGGGGNQDSWLLFAVDQQPGIRGVDGD
jgi:hypothetical protein